MTTVEKTFMIPMYYHVHMCVDGDSDYGPPEAYAIAAADEGKSQYAVEGFASHANVYTEPSFEDIRPVVAHANAAEEAYALLWEVGGHLRRLRKLAGESPAAEVRDFLTAFHDVVEYVGAQRVAHRQQAELCAFINHRETP